MTVPVPGPPPDPRSAVRRAVADLDDLAGRPLIEHVEAFERVHTTLGEVLAAGSADQA